MHQGACTINEYVTEFRTWQDHSQLNEQALSNYFCTGLNTGILKAILGFQMVPNTLQLWQDQAMVYDRHMRVFQDVHDRNHAATAWKARPLQTHSTRITPTP